ncbi:MAG: GeoRSP system SPASM domain protein [Desulfuromonadia bacterium]
MELETPLSLLWDCDDPVDPLLVEDMFRQLESIPILSIHLTLDGAIPPWLWDLLDDQSILPGRRILLTIPLEHVSTGTTPRRVQSTFLAIRSASELDRLPSPTGASGISLPTTFPHDPACFISLLGRAYDRGIRTIHVPIPRSASPYSRSIPTPEGYGRLTRHAATRQLPDDLRLIVHDPFLWEALHPGRGGWSSGCQGGNAQIHIDGRGIVRGCPLIPAPLGDITQTPLGEILAGEERRRLREALRLIPDECLRCERVSRCQGGCRGRGRVTGRDPLCPHLPAVRGTIG